MFNRKWRHNSRSVDSAFERILIEGVLSGAEYHPLPIKYSVDHKYTPDFKITSRSSTIFIEVKGRFMDSQEASKYLWIRDYLKTSEELVFLFQKPDLPMPNVKKRKDGTKMTHSEWSVKNGFRWFDINTIKEIL